MIEIKTTNTFHELDLCQNICDIFAIVFQLFFTIVFQLFCNKNAKSFVTKYQYTFLRNLQVVTRH